ncbi:MAG: DNA repair protein RecN [Vicingaceae bacterium]
MLKQLSVQNFALIDQIKIDFDNGLSVITGETGAGKSILLGALSLILGNRADHDSLKDKTQKCIIEGAFDVSNYDLKSFFDHVELDYADNTIIRREINPQGKSRNFINDTPTTLGVMKSLGSRLIDIHSQHQSLKINDAVFQLEVLDALANNQTRLSNYQAIYSEFKQLSAKLDELRGEAAESKTQEDYLNFQFEELEALSLKEGEVEGLEIEQERFANSEEIINNMSQLITGLSQGETNVVDSLSQLKQLLSQTEKFDASLKEESERLTSLHIELLDLAAELESKAENFHHDPERQEIVEERLAEVHRLQVKHQLATADELIPLKIKLEQQLEAISTVDLQIIATEKELNKSKKDLEDLAIQLSKKRNEASKKLILAVENTIHQLGMQYAKLEVSHTNREDFNQYGLDDFEFLFSANKGMQPQLISKTASGGEISRLMLAIKRVLAEYKQMPTILFDEIDTGVSGEVANQMGIILEEIASQRQVISITHLPQIAAKGKSHFYVYKQEGGERSVSQMKRLNHDERVEEIAKMLSGSKLSEAARINAKELLSQ